MDSGFEVCGSSVEVVAGPSANGTGRYQAASTQLGTLRRQFSQRLEPDACHFDTYRSSIFDMSRKHSRVISTSVQKYLRCFVKEINPLLIQPAGVGRCESSSVQYP